MFEINSSNEIALLSSLDARFFFFEKRNFEDVRTFEDVNIIELRLLRENYKYDGKRKYVSLLKKSIDGRLRHADVRCVDDR